jgi:hypothetical protein
VLGGVSLEHCAGTQGASHFDSAEGGVVRAKHPGSANREENLPLASMEGAVDAWFDPSAHAFLL